MRIEQLVQIRREMCSERSRARDPDNQHMLACCLVLFVDDDDGRRVADALQRAARNATEP